MAVPPRRPTRFPELTAHPQISYLLRIVQAALTCQRAQIIELQEWVARAPERRLDETVSSRTDIYEDLVKIVGVPATDIRQKEERIAEFELRISDIAAALDQVKALQESEVVDEIHGYVDDIEGDLVYVKFMVGGARHRAVFARQEFEKANAAFFGARVRFLTVKTHDPANPFDLRVELEDAQPLRRLTPDVLRRLERLEELEEDE